MPGRPVPFDLLFGHQSQAICLAFFVNNQTDTSKLNPFTIPMKRLALLVLPALLISCGKRHHIFPKDVTAIRPVFKDSTFQHWQGYHIGNEVVAYDGMSENVEAFLTHKMSDRNSFPQDSTPDRISKLLGGRKSAKLVPLPIKSVPLSEFGYLELANGKVVLYGIMGMDGFSDLTHRCGYYTPVKK